MVSNAERTFLRFLNILTPLLINESLAAFSNDHNRFSSIYKLSFNFKNFTIVFYYDLNIATSVPSFLLFYINSLENGVPNHS